MKLGQWEKDWHLWFAWYPARTGVNDTWVWMETVWRTRWKNGYGQKCSTLYTQAEMASRKDGLTKDH
jgi:hypothetical protein